MQGTERITAIVRTGRYRFSRNLIYVSFVALVLGLAIWLDDLWLVLTLVPAVAVIALIAIPKEEGFLERNFQERYTSDKAAVRPGYDGALAAALSPRRG